MPTKLLVSTAALALVAACAAPLTPENAALNDLQDDYPDATAVEASILDENNDGVIDASERQAIDSDDPDSITLSDG